LRRSGRLTDEQAEDHPQRSIITRALGPEREVEVDTMTYRARPGDVYLLCSDGLTTMLREERIEAVLSEAPSLDEAVERLVGEANDAGGRDNITVVAFRLDEAMVPAEAPEGATLVGPAAEEAGLTAEGVAAASRRSTADATAERVITPGRQRRGLGVAVKVLASVLVTVGLAAVAVWGVRQIYFLGSDTGGRLALYRGLPYDLPLDIRLYSEVHAAPVQVGSLPANRRDSAVNHTLRFHDDAVSLLRDLQSAAERSAAKESKAASGKPNGDKSRKSGGGGGGGSNDRSSNGGQDRRGDSGGGQGGGSSRGAGQ
jgi:protein phosphatase